jgi:hypothetical protein
MYKTTQWAVAEITHRNGTKSRMSKRNPPFGWPSQLLGDADVIAVELIRHVPAVRNDALASQLGQLADLDRALGAIEAVQDALLGDAGGVRG